MNNMSLYGQDDKHLRVQILWTEEHLFCKSVAFCNKRRLNFAQYFLVLMEHPIL